MDKYKGLQKPLEISDIDFRVQSINKGGYATILAYKDARVDMKRLDDVVGIEYWQRDVKIINNTLYGGVGIYNKDIKEWIWKWDAGTESNTEKEKGQSSDAFKRACFNFGIGRELYNYPVISIKLEESEMNKKGDRIYASYGFKLKEWKWLSQFTDGELTFLAAKDTNNKMRFKWGEYDKKRDLEEGTASGTPTSNPEEHLSEKTARGTSDNEEKGNISGVLKKPKEDVKQPTEEDVYRNELVQKYKILFGKEPRANTKTETLESKIATETEKKAKAKNEENSPTEPLENKDVVKKEEKVEKKEDPYSNDNKVEDVEVEEVDLGMYSGEIAEDAVKIETFTDKEELKSWAVETFKKWSGKAPEEHIAEFKEACNRQFEKIG